MKIFKFEAPYVNTMCPYVTMCLTLRVEATSNQSRPRRGMVCVIQKLTGIKGYSNK